MHLEEACLKPHRILMILQDNISDSQYVTVKHEKGEDIKFPRPSFLILLGFSPLCFSAFQGGRKSFINSYLCNCPSVLPAKFFSPSLPGAKTRSFTVSIAKFYAPLVLQQS